ncbi:hypothetical protein CNMCM5793_003925 [Aspergillus hiratsukae]|uniref:Uncharacterized protein n=1 Tax=Aspergillus hiratsukae TaxID=1194566 RepID=A0A8H6QB90_9EURO|nr:hypothetical protein CNMCM5793_003925 [Aspergillus hiratsukae]KAF7169234.1 hypothetical protein CNMCM6106_004183 [Aspergillus hiratsukae]
MQFTTILSLLAVAGLTVATPPGVPNRSNDVVGVNVDHNNIPVDVNVPVKDNNIANDVLEDGVNVDNVPVNAGVLGNAQQFAPEVGRRAF